MYNLDNYDRMAYEQLFHEFVEDQMKEQRNKTMLALSTILTPDYVEDLAKILCVALKEENSNAEKLWHQLGFSQLDYFAILEDKKEYFGIYQDECDMEVHYE
jgi:hypothetical protein